MAVNCGTQVEFTGQDSISVYDSSEWAERGFCSQCGTHLFYRLKGNQQHIMPLRVIEGGENQIFVEEKSKHYDFANQTKMMTGEEAFAQFAQDK